jgi:7-alpha-hydroxysteroid dehydrogenase
VADVSGLAEQFRLDGRVAVVTGAGKGIGAAIAVTFAQAGADVSITARTAGDLEVVAERLHSYGRRALAVPGDVNDLAFLAALVDRTVAELGSLEVPNCLPRHMPDLQPSSPDTG